MSDPMAPSPSLAYAPALARVGRAVFSILAYLGAIALLFGAAARSGIRRSVVGPSLRSIVAVELGWMLGMGLPLVALVHVGMGSFLAMQSYYGGTFVEGTGAVVGVGLFRNIAAMLSGLTFAGLIAARVTADHRARLRDARTPHPRPGFLEREAEDRGPKKPPVAIPFARVVAGQLIAAAVAGLVLAVWGAGVGTLVGWQVAEGLMGVSTHSFFLMFWEMLWGVDVVGLAVKGLSFGLASALLACHEGSRGAPGDGLGEVSWAACRAACFSALAILVLNSGWFLVMYHAGPAFGPTLLTPPSS